VKSGFADRPTKASVFQTPAESDKIWIGGRSHFFSWQRREGAAMAPKIFLKKVKEGVDSLVSLYIFTNPSRDYGHSLGNVLRQSASST
jgi:sensor c-di-GMP phosphodiesterase-like protein